MSKTKEKTQPVKYKLDVYERIADRIVQESMGVIIAENNNHQYQKGDLLEFNVLEEGYGALHCMGHPLNDQIYEVTGAYTGRGIEQGYVVLLVKYWGSNDSDD